MIACVCVLARVYGYDIRLCQVMLRVYIVEYYISCFFNMSWALDSPNS